MDTGSILTLLLLAVFLACQPWSVLGGVLLVTSRRGLVKEGAYVAGWVSALAAVAAVTVAVYPGVPRSTTTTRARAVVELVIGLGLGAWLAWRWRHPRELGTPREPAWMGRVDGMSPVLAFGLGAFLPTYAVVAAAVTEMLGTGLSEAALVAVAAGWVLLASAGVAAPLLVLVTKREHAAQTYGRWRAWIVTHSRTVLYSVGGLVSVLLVVKGVVGLFG